jgi:hypothetical protein
MAAPEFVPTRANETVRTYASPPRRPDSWRAERPGDLGGAGQPRGDSYGNQGPDQGYALGLVRRFDGRLHLTTDEHPDDVSAGVVAVALKRASIFGRAPVVHDLRIAYTVWGFLDDPVAAELVAARSAAFAGVAHPHHYSELGAVADAVPASTLELTPDAVASQHAASWQSLLSLAALGTDHAPH